MGGKIGQLAHLEAVRSHLNQELQQSGAMVGRCWKHFPWRKGSLELGSHVQYRFFDGDDEDDVVVVAKPR